jgi:hypothetical protein
MRINSLVGISSALALVAFSSGVALAGPPPPPPPTMTTIDQTVGQVNLLSGQGGGGLESASATGKTFQYASGNIGLNVAGGSNNQQANSAYIDGKGDPGVAYTGGFSQTTLGAASAFDGANTATANKNAFQYASGNIGASIAGGDQNQQNNAMALVDFATSAKWNDSQEQAFTLSAIDGANRASVTNNAFQHAKGNIGLNVASGSLNQQSNGLLVSSSTLGSVSSNIDQAAAVSIGLLNGGNVATASGNSFQYASGNIGANVAAGVGNQQANVTVIQP